MSTLVQDSRLAGCEQGARVLTVSLAQVKAPPPSAQGLCAFFRLILDHG